MEKKVALIPLQGKGCWCGQDPGGRVRHRSQGRAMNANLRGQGRGGSQKQDKQVETKANMKGMRGSRGMRGPAVTSN